MAFLPTATVTAPTIQKARYGLFSVVNVIPTNDPHIAGGVDYESSLFCAGGNVIVGDDTCSGPALGEEGGGPAYTEAVPAIVNAQYECKGPMDLPAFQAGAIRALEANTERFLSAALFDVIFDPADATEVAPGSLTAMEALAALEGAARTFYSGQPIIHAGATVISLVTEGNQIDRAGDHLETKLGTRIDPLANQDDDVMYLTGAITIWQGNNQVFGPLAVKTGGGQYDNTFRTVAMIPVAVANDCGLFYKVSGIVGP